MQHSGYKDYDSEPDFDEPESYARKEARPRLAQARIQFEIRSGRSRTCIIHDQRNAFPFRGTVGMGVG